MELTISHMPSVFKILMLTRRIIQFSKTFSPDPDNRAKRIVQYYNSHSVCLRTDSVIHLARSMHIADIIQTDFLGFFVRNRLENTQFQPRFKHTLNSVNTVLTFNSRYRIIDIIYVIPLCELNWDDFLN